MIAAVILVLVLVMPDRSVEAITRTMPSLSACEHALQVYLTPHPSLTPDALVRERRSGRCLTVPVHGRDA